MTTLRLPSLINMLKVGLIEAKVNLFHSHSVAKRQFDRSEKSIMRDFAGASMKQRMRAGDCSLSVILGNNLANPYSNGDIDLLASYEKFSIFEYPSLPFAVRSLRDALGKHQVTSILTEEHLKVHDRMVSACGEFIDSEDDDDDAVERKLNKLGAFIFANMDSADSILSIVENRQLLVPKDIAAVLQVEDAAPALMEGAL